MSGFPTRAGRDAFGPDPINSRRVRDPRRQLDGESTGRLMFWQLGGLGLISPLATITATVVAASLALQTHAEAFQPRGGAAPTPARTGTGVYTFTFIDEYPDEQGNDATLTIRGGAAFALGATPLHGQIEVTSAHAVTVRFWDLAGSAADAESMLVVLW
jgi:hypothetical protein